jgi:hypothetical protein
MAAGSKAVLRRWCSVEVRSAADQRKPSRAALASLVAFVLIAGCSTDPKPLPLMADSLLVKPVDWVV